MKAFECTGFWDLPGGSAPLAGTLRVSRDGEARLLLIGELGFGSGYVANKSHKIIVGSVDKSPRGNEVTLSECVLTGKSMGSFYGRREEYRIARCYFGAHLEKEDDFRFRACLVELGGLSEWAAPLSGLHKEGPSLPTSKHEGKSIPIATYLVPPRPQGQVPGGKITLNMGVSSKSDAQTVSFREEANLLIEFDAPRTADEINADYVYPLQNLMTFVTDRPQEMERLSVWRGRDLSKCDTNPDIQVVEPRVQPDEEESEDRKDSRAGELLFTFGDVDFSNFMGRWLSLASSHHTAFNIFFGIQYGPPAYIDMAYALVAQSLMLYFTRTAEGVALLAEEEKTLKELLQAVPQHAAWLYDHIGATPYPPFYMVLKQLVDAHGPILDPLIVGRRDAFVNQGANTLRYIEQRRDEEYLAASQGPDLYWLMQRIRFLIKACFMKELGFGAAKIRELFARNAYYQHMSKLEMVREKNKVAPREVNLSFQFVIPVDAVLDAARKLAASTNQDERAIGAAVIELTDITSRTKAAVENVAGKDTYDLAVYLDYKFGDSISAAQRLKLSPDKEVRYVAETLISQSEAVASSKAAVLEATKQG